MQLYLTFADNDGGGVKLYQTFADKDGGWGADLSKILLTKLTFA